MIAGCLMFPMTLAEETQGRMIGDLPGAVPRDFALALELQDQRKFTANDIKSFVYHVFSLYERATSARYRKGVDAFRNLLDENVIIDFPDYKIANWDDFTNWHSWIHGQLVGDDHTIGSVDVDFLSDGRYEVSFFVRWRALFKTGKYVDACVGQVWTLREEANRDLPVIETYVAKLASNDAPCRSDKP
jgi:hypothetical protein